MREDVFVYVTSDLPENIHSACVPCVDGYNIYINERLDDLQRQAAYVHELAHIDLGHCEADIDVDRIEGEVHGEQD